MLNNVACDHELREKAHNSFCRATDSLEHALYVQFGKKLDVDIIFYLGLCNGAGWVTKYHGHTVASVYKGILHKTTKNGLPTY